MKNKLFLLALLSVAIVSCQKEDNTIVTSSSGDGSTIRQGSPVPVIGNPPATFTQKMLLENFTGAPYAKVPQNDYTISQLQSLYPNRVITASFHKNDRMETIATSSLLNFVSNGSLPTMPSAMLNRIVFSGKMINEMGTWEPNVPYSLSGTPKIGLAIQSAMQGNILNMNIHVGFNAATPGTYKICAYVVENTIHQPITGYNQANGFNTDSSSPFYNLGDPIVNYTHNNVVRTLGTTLSGITIPSSYQVTGGHMIQPIAVDITSNINFTNAYVVAYVYNTSNQMVMNAQIAKIGTIKTWD